MIIFNKIENIIQIVEEAGDILRKIYKKQELDIEMKADSTPVTEADKISNDFLQSKLRELFPEIPIISEESDIPDFSTRSKWKYTWILDPLDGTKEFIYKNGRFCINIALLENNIPLFGIINNIQDNEILWAFKNEKCYIRKDGKTEILTSKQNNDSIIKMAVSRFNITETEFEYIDYLQAKGFQLELIPLGASSKHCEIAKGNIDVCAKFGKCYEWDTVAGQLLIETSGGMVINAETHTPLAYNKKDLINPPFLMFNKKQKEKIEKGNQSFINFSKIN